MIQSQSAGGSVPPPDTPTLQAKQFQTLAALTGGNSLASGQLATWQTIPAYENFEKSGLRFSANA